MASATVVDKQNVNTPANAGYDTAFSEAEKQSIRRLISAITGAAIQSLSEMHDSDYSIGVAMFKRWESAQSALESMKGKPGVVRSHKRT